MNYKLQQFASHSVSKFLLVGTFATAIQYASLIALVEFFSVYAVLSSALAYIMSALSNYLLNYYFTFKSKAKHHIALLKFLVVATIALTLNTAIMYLSVEMLQWHYMASQVLATLLVLIWNYLAHMLWTYRSAAIDQPVF